MSIRNKKVILRYSIIGIFILISAIFGKDVIDNNKEVTTVESNNTLSDIPEYVKEPYTKIANGLSNFTEKEKSILELETYSSDNMGRCTTAFALITKDTMPTEERGAIGMVKPTGWQTIKYDFISGKYLYNRCHLIGFQLAGENANEENLITGTRYLNIEGMLPFENMVADYIKETNNSVLYRVTPIYTDSNLIADGLTIEAYSVEDQGDGINFYVYCYNVQPGVIINYEDGSSKAE